MKNYILISLLTSTVLMGNSFTNPLPASVKTIDNGGTKSAIDAYKDGIGAELVDQPGVATDNSAMNILTIKYGEAAKTNNVTIINQVLNVNSNPTSADLALAGKLTIDGAACNDGNVQTINDIYTNGLCLGVVPVSCNNIHTLDLTLISGVYTIDPDGNGPISQFLAYCDMTTDGGGWTLIVKSQISSNAHSNINAVDILISPTQISVAKFSDSVINSIPKSIYKVTNSLQNISVYFDLSDSFSSVRQVANKASKTYINPVWEGPFYNNVHRGFNTHEISSFNRSDPVVVVYTGFDPTDTCRLGVAITNGTGFWCGTGDASTVWLK